MDLVGNLVDLSAMRLRIEAEHSWLEGGAAGTEGTSIAPGSERLVREHFRARAPSAMALESAIADIEDELARVPHALHGAAITSSDPALHAIAAAVGVDGTAPILHRDAVEHAFNHLAAVADGRPAASGSLPEDPRFAAALLLVRELMHHLDIATIALQATPTQESTP